jgi:radical SAM protein with 4Fe4S-binding SPASM domain
MRILDFVSPAIVDIELTQRCPQRCSFCVTAASDRLNKTREELSFEHLISLADQLQELGVHHVFFTGGEPTIRRDFVKLVKEYLDRGIFPSTSTNGQFLNERILEELYSIGYTTMHFSIEGPEGIHDKITDMKGSYGRAIKNLELSLSMGFLSAVSSVGIKDNYDYLPELVNELVKIKPKAYRVLRFFPTNLESLALLPSRKQVEENIPKIYDICKRQGIPFFFKLSPGLLRERTPKDVYEICNSCEAGKIRLDILADGSVVPCKFFKTPDFILGNIKTARLQEIWKNEKLRPFKGLNPAEFTGMCGKCRNKFNCYSCRAIAYNITDNLCGDDVSCFKLRNEKRQKSA